MLRLSSLLFLAATAAAWAQPAADAWPTEPVPSATQRIAVLEDKRIDESSGLCLSASDPSIFWTHNDSGGEPCIFAIDREGKTRAKVRLPDAVNFDWEDITMGKDETGAPALFIGDIGDNFHIRPSIQVYQIPEPAIAGAGSPVDETVSAAPKLWRAYYPDGKPNAESLLAHPVTGRLFILTKNEDGISTLYGFPQPLQPGTSMVLEKVARLSFPPLGRHGKRPNANCQATAAAFSNDGSHLVVGTYSSFYEWKLPKGQPFSDALKKAPVRIEPLIVGQMEGACYDADGKTIWFTSERLPAPLVKLTRP